MKIKNIKQYREVFKNVIRQMPDRSENFIGNYYYDEVQKKRVRGWFDLYFGQADGNSTAQKGVENKLISFLDMARDGQAIYEFLQNAVDAGASKYLMFFKTDEKNNEDYLLVINNGEMFTTESIISILNIGSSTKIHNSEKIGQFGIGFKLAHRLVGRNNAISELIDDLNGPILYSWTNNEIANLDNNVKIEDLNYSFDERSHELTVQDENSWLFKILLTTFPCAYNEKPIIWDGKEATKPPFSEEELHFLINWIKEKEIQQHISSDFEQGALFLMKLGEGKLKEIKDEPNLKEGVRFSLAILKETSSNVTGLSTAVINGEEIHHPELKFHKIIIPKENDDDYAFIRFGKSYNELDTHQINEIANESAIQILYGFKNYQEIGNYFNGAPNFYLYFPISQEVHNFNYIIHSNALYKGSSRDFLQAGGGKGLNERLFKIVVEKLETDLRRLFKEDFDKFINLYSAFLTSGETQNNQSEWITENYTRPLNELLKKIVPVKNNTGEKSLLDSTTSRNSIYVIDTQINPEIGILEDNNYFILDKSELSYEYFIKAIEKLGVKTYTIYDVLNIENISHRLNTWINNKKENAELFYKELTEKENIHRPGSLTDVQKSNLKEIKWIKITDGTYKAINEIEGDIPIILLNEVLSPVKEILRKLNLLMSENDLSVFIDKFRGNFQQNELKQFTYLTLTKYFNEQVENEYLDKLTSHEKFQLFEAFRTLDDNPRERINILKLYKNNLGIYQPFERLANIRGGLLGLLSIEDSQLQGIDTKNLQTYLNVDQKTLYEKLYYPQWKGFLKFYISNPDCIKISNIVSELQYAYKHSNWDDKATLATSELIIFKDEVVRVKNIFIPTDLNIEHFQKKQDLLKDYFGIYIPDEPFLELFSSKEPFGYKTTSLSPEISLKNLSLEKVKEILDLAREFNIDLFENNVIEKQNEVYTINTFSVKQQYFSDNENIVDIISHHYHENFVLLPNELKEYKEMIKMKDYNLYKILIEDGSVYTDEDSVVKLLEVAITFDENSRVELFSNMEVFKIDLRNTHQSILQKLEFINSIKRVGIEDLQEKIVLLLDDEEIYFSDLKPSISSLKLNDKEIDFEKIFGENGNNIGVEFYHRFVERSESLDRIFFRKLLRLDSVENMIELKNQFIQSLNDGNKIDNIYQLYFLIYSNAFTQSEIKEFYILNANEEFWKLDKSWTYIEDFAPAFFNPSEIIHLNYGEERDLLNDLIEKSDIGLVKYFRLDSETDYSVLNLENDFSLNQKLNFLYEVYNKTPHANLSPIVNLVDEFLGITSNDKIVSSQFYDDNAEVNEIIIWVDNEDKRKFLKNLEFQFEDSLSFRFLNSIQNNEEDFSEYNVYQFTENEINLIIQFIYDREITLELSNEELRKKVVEIFKIYYRSVPDKMLVYKNGNSFKVANSDILYGFDYHIIDQVFNNADNNLLEDFFTQYPIPIKEIAEEVDSESLEDIDYYFEIIRERADLINEYYYQEWKKNVKNISIYKADELTYNLYVNLNDEYEPLCEISYRDDFHIESEGNSLLLYFTSNNSLKSLVDYFTSEEFEQYETFNLTLSLKKLEEQYNSFNATISEVLEKTDIEEIKGYFQTQIEKEERKAHRESISTEINETLPYSKNWFMKYLEYLNTVSEKNSSDELKYLRFSKIEKTDKPRFYKLSGCNSVIPENIDESVNVNIRIITANQKQSFNIQNISQKNQTVLIQLNEELSDTLIDNFFVGEITYIPTIDLLARLTNAFHHLEDWEDINLKFPPIQYIYGPPGTGKTTSLKNEIIGLTEDNSSVKILVLTPTNKACDVLAEKLFQEGYEQFIRLSSPTSTQIPEEFYRNQLNNETLDELNVLISTIHRHSYFKVSTEHSQYFLYNYSDWDYVIIDEASMINLPYITFSSLITHQNNPECKLIIAGDPKQIPPVPELKDAEREEIGVETENIYSMFGLKSFDKENQRNEIREIDDVINLPIQYRSLPEIGYLFSQFSYQGKVLSDRNPNSRRVLPAEVQRFLSDTITFLNVPLERDNQLFSINKLIYSSYHLYSGLLIYEFIRFFDKYNQDNEHWTIGIISPYKAQAVLVNRLIADLKLKTNIRVFADTVHGFQGDECDIIFFICNPSSYQNSPHPNSLLSNDFIYNVAISRARDYLVIVNPFEEITGNNWLNNLIRIYYDYTQQNVVIQSSNKLEEIMFGRRNWLDENTFITRHDDVNVYSSEAYKYYIKKNEISIDFQIKNMN